MGRSRIPMRSTSARIAACLLSIPLIACSSNKPREMSDEDKIEYYYGNALNYYELGELDRAEDQIWRGFEIDSREKRLNLLYGWVLQRRGKPEDVRRAEQVFRRLLDHKDYRVTLGLAVALERKGVLYDKAARDVASGKLRVEGGDPQARARELAELAVDAWNEAVTFFEKTLAASEDERDALSGLTRVQALLGNAERSLAANDRLIELIEAKKQFLQRQLDREDIRAPDEERFRAALREEVALEVGARLHAATLLRRTGDNEKAAEHLGAVIELQPDLAEAHSRLAQVLFDLGRHERAIYEIDRYLRLSTDTSFDDPSIRQAYDLRSRAEAALASASGV